ncbi:MAG: tRNA-dihydrouridine synthase B [Halieaceae bacterium]|jgi:tRNA-dihydrouridine synthase B
MLQIGPYSLPNPVVLAPMAGVTDLPFRQLCREHGAGMVVAEMLTSDTRLWNTRKSQWRMDHRGEAQPITVQIAGSDPAMLAAAAAGAVDRGAQIIDINMGCPAKKVCNKAAGSALLRDEALVADILNSVVRAVAVPVTLKIRTGWSPEERNAVAIARIAEDAGIQALAVHGRTRACRFTGEVEYETITKIKQAVTLPVIANGDICSPQQAAAVMAATGADGIMIGRAAQGQPWLCGQIADYLATGQHTNAPSAAQQALIIDGHLRSIHQFYGDYMGTRIARKHMAWYLPGEHHREFRKQFNTLECPEFQVESINTYLAVNVVVRENNLATPTESRGIAA